MAIDINRFLKEKRYQVAAAPPASVAGDLEQIAGADKLAEGKVRFWLIVGIVFALASIAGFAFPPALIVTLPLMALGFIMRAVRKRGDIDDRRYQLPRELLKLLEVDMGDDPRFDLDLCFARCDRKDTFTHKGQAGTWNVKYYRDAWLRLGGRFCDGTGFELQLVDLQQNRSKWKTNPRGKRKYKTKEKHGAEFVVSLKPKSKRYGAVEQLSDDLAGAVKLPPGAIMKKAVYDGKSLAIVAALKGGEWEAERPPAAGQPSPTNAVQMFAMMLLSAYHVLGLAREMTKREGAA